MLILPDDGHLQYSGRIDFTDAKAPVMIWPCSSVRFRFRGSSVGVTVYNRREYWSSYLGYLIDGRQGKVRLPESGRASFTLAEGLADTEHEVILFKRMDACHLLTLLGIELSEGAVLCEPPDRPERRIEVYGDSVSAGEVSEAIDYIGQPDPVHDGEYSNSYYSYAWLTARKLRAEIHDVAQGGIALLHGTGWFHEPDAIGMEEAYDKLQYNPSLGEVTEWDFSRYTPHVVIVAVGQNDNHPEDYMAADYRGAKAQQWREGYRGFVRRLREIYPAAWIVLTTTILEHDANWDRAIEEVCRYVADERVRHFMYSKNGRGTPGHIRIPEAEQMAEELAAFIGSLGEAVWN